MDIYKLVKRQASFFVNISSKLSTVNEYFKIPTFFMDEHYS